MLPFGQVVTLDVKLIVLDEPPQSSSATPPVMVAPAPSQPSFVRILDGTAGVLTAPSPQSSTSVAEGVGHGACCTGVKAGRASQSSSVAIVWVGWEFQGLFEKEPRLKPRPLPRDPPKGKKKNMKKSRSLF